MKNDKVNWINPDRASKAILAVVLTASIGTAAPRDELLRLAPKDSAFCLVVQDLRGQLQSLLNSPFVRALRASPLGACIAKASETKTLAELDEYVQKCLGISSARLRDDILGDAIVFAYRFNPHGKNEADEGLVLVRARDAKLLATLVERLNRCQKKSGELLRVEERRLGDASYYRRVHGDGEDYYYLNGPVLMFTREEPMLKRALRQDRDGAAGGEPSISVQLSRLGVQQQPVQLWINPRAFDAEIERKAARSRGVGAVVLPPFLKYWKTLEGIALSLELDKYIDLKLAMRARTADLPPAARRFFREAAKPSMLWSRLPTNGILAAAGRLDLPSFAGILCDFLTGGSFQSMTVDLQRHVGAIMEKNVLKDVFPCIGPDWGLCVLRPPTAPPSGWFPHAVLALRAARGSTEPGIDQGLLSILLFYARLVVFADNFRDNGGMTLKTTRIGSMEVKYLVDDRRFPPGLQPAAGLHNGYLIVGASPEAIRRFLAGPADRLASSGPETPLLKFSAREMNHFLKEQREPLIAAVMAKKKLSKEAAQQRLDKVSGILQLFDRVELLQRTEPGRLTLSLRIQPAEPLK